MSDIQIFDPSVNLMQAILWQYEDAEKLKAIVEAKQAWTNSNQTEFWRSWYRDVFNIDTANDFGLSVWARILDVPLQVENSAQEDKKPFGFGANNNNFVNGNFGVVAGSAQRLGTEQQRLVIRMRYFQLTSRCTVPEINSFLADVFKDMGRAFVFDPLDMSFVLYTFGFAPDSQLQFILNEYDLLPRPAGVGVRWQAQALPSFGFGIYNLNFNNGNFGA